MATIYRLGTRKSALARTQSQSIADELGKRGIACRLIEVSSSGDQDRTRPLYEMEDLNPGLFCKRLQDALLAGEIDLAVHSLKDLPTQGPPGLRVFAVPFREAPGDCLIVHPRALDKAAPIPLSPGATVGTSSLRRESQLWAARPDLKIVSLRGNVPGRVAQVRDGKLDAAVLAEAGLRRLALDLRGVHLHALPVDRFVPAPAQGALAVEAAESSAPELLVALQSLNAPALETQTRIERRVMRDLEGGCTLPLGVLCEPVPEGWRLRAALGVAQNSARGSRDWVAVEHFDICLASEDALVDKTVNYFRSLRRR